MNLEDESKDCSLETFDSICKGLEESMGYEQKGSSLFSLTMYLRPSFLLEHSNHWQHGFDIILKHIQSKEIPPLKRRKAIGCLAIILDESESVEIDGQIVRISQRDMLKERGIYHRAIDSIMICKDTTTASIARTCRAFLEMEDINSFES